MAEWLGNGLQNRVRQFESAWYLTKKGDFLNRKSPFFMANYKTSICFTDIYKKNSSYKTAVFIKLSNSQRLPFRFAFTFELA